MLENERKAFIYGDRNPDGSVNCVGCVANGVPEDVANEIFDEMTSFASYAFNKSHAAAYATLSYQTAYLKLHYFKEYMAALITSVLDSLSKVTEYTDECEKKGVKVSGPDINLSMEGFVVNSEGINFGLLAIKSLGRGAIRDIIAERERGGKFASLGDFLSRMYGKELNSRAVESLIMSGALDSFPNNRREMLSSYDYVMNVVADSEREKMEGQMDLFGNGGEESIESISDIRIPKQEEFSISELLEMEKQILGVYISGHPLSKYSPWLTASDMLTVKEIINGVADSPPKYRDGDEVKIIAMFRSKKMFMTKKNQQMCFTEFEDVSGNIEVIVFPKIFEVARTLLNPGASLAISGKISVKEDEEPKLLADLIQNADYVVSKLSQLPLCLRFSSDEKDKIAGIREICRSNPGDGRLMCYLSDVKKLTVIKDAASVNITGEVIAELKKLLGAENVKFRRQRDGLK